MQKATAHLIRNKLIYLAALFLLIVIVISTVLFLQDSQQNSQPPVTQNTNYTYESLQATNGVELHILRTAPESLTFKTINGNVTASGSVGINGGFFWQQSLLSIAVENDQPVNGEQNAHGSGWFNTKYARGTLVYDRIAKRLSVQVVSNAAEIQVTDHSAYWAQGGVSLLLQDEPHFRQSIEKEALPVPDELRLRSGIVYDVDNYIYLIVSSTKCTAEQFRQSIVEYESEHPLVDGIYLDGDGSSQLMSNEMKLIGDGRAVIQMIAIHEDE
ncbi:MAG: hypothetical protein P0Y55_13095 [Candidatus Cohnella colombiensis]|uniref:Phosphodiester glycosidase domain-containing protein n=1 Tax=Candidatus Cohnella colombiensis TaxID=3121368 RepID=A0AA95JB11_9BACL|nr:MAG: hypothetical protein P0Y55_13095 [Cohnella sp.]